ncbi:MAG: tetratricopeptide repeat protein, partial [Spirochaetes bacterium]|nr:tetratricopeptide repeat protein [Spirochaetota bacterium]
MKKFIILIAILGIGIRAFSEKGNDFYASYMSAIEKLSTAEKIQYLSSQIDSWKAGDEIKKKFYLHILRADAYLEAQRFEKAVNDYNIALEINPSYYFALNNRGIAHKQLGEFPQAYIDYTKALEIRPDFYIAYYNRGIVNHAMGNLKEALKDFSDAISGMPTMACAYNNRGVVYHAMGDFEKALADYNAALELD